MSGASARIAVTEETRDAVRDLKRGGETYDELLAKMAAQYDPDAARGYGLRVVFEVRDGGDGPPERVFVECEDETGRSVDAGEWRPRDDGFEELVVEPGVVR